MLVVVFICWSCRCTLSGWQKKNLFMGKAERSAGKMNEYPAYYSTQRKRKRKRVTIGMMKWEERWKKIGHTCQHHKHEPRPMALKKNENACVACSAFQLSSYAPSSTPSESGLPLKCLNANASAHLSHAYTADITIAYSIVTIMLHIEQPEESTSPIKCKNQHVKVMPKCSLCIRDAWGREIPSWTENCMVDPAF